MAQQIDKQLVKAIVDMAIFLEFSPESILDADASIEAMEQMAAALRAMPDENRRSLVETFVELAPSYGKREDFVSNLAENLGLT